MNNEDTKYKIIARIAKAQDLIGTERAVEIQNIIFGGGPLIEKTIFDLNEILDFMRFYYKGMEKNERK